MERTRDCILCDTVSVTEFFGTSEAFLANQFKCTLTNHIPEGPIQAREMRDHRMPTLRSLSLIDIEVTCENSPSYRTIGCYGESKMNRLNW